MSPKETPTDALVLFSMTGCQGDGTFGHDHIRLRLREALERVNSALTAKGLFSEAKHSLDLIEALKEPMSDDAEEEYEAMSHLDSYTKAGLTWVMRDGDLLIEEV